MIDEQPHCENPVCGLPIVVLAAHRARILAENQARYEALQLQLALHEREIWRG